MSFQCHSMTTQLWSVGVYRRGGGGTHFAPKSVYVEFSRNDHRTSKFRFDLYTDLTDTTVVYGKLPEDGKEWRISGQWRARETVSIHASPVRSGVKFRAFVRIRCIAKIVTAPLNFLTKQQIATHIWHVKGLFPSSWKHIHHTVSTRRFQSIVLNTHTPQYKHMTFPKHRLKHTYTTL